MDSIDKMYSAQEIITNPFWKISVEHVGDVSRFLPRGVLQQLANWEEIRTLCKLKTIINNVLLFSNCIMINAPGQVESCALQNYMYYLWSRFRVISRPTSNLVSISRAPT